MTQQKDEVQQKPRNFLYSDVLKNNKVVPIWKERKGNAIHKQTNEIEQSKALNINNTGKKHQDQLHPRAKVTKNHWNKN